MESFKQAGSSHPDCSQISLGSLTISRGLCRKLVLSLSAEFLSIDLVLSPDAVQDTEGLVGNHLPPEGEAGVGQR